MLFRINMIPKNRWTGFVRLVGLSLSSLAVGSGALAQTGAEIQPRLTPVAVVDMEHVLDNHPTFTAQMESMKAEFQQTMKDFEERRKKLSESIQQLNSQLNSDSPEFKQREEAIVVKRASCGLTPRTSKRSSMSAKHD